MSRPSSGSPSPVAAVIERGRSAVVAGAERRELSSTDWTAMVAALARDPVEPVALWSDGESVHLLLPPDPDDPSAMPLIASLPVEQDRFPAVSPVRPALSLSERMLRDLWGIDAIPVADPRPLLDRSAWPCTAPLSARPGSPAYPPEPAEFPLRPGESAAGAFQLGLGPSGSVLVGPAHLRLVLSGNRILRADPLLGFTHRGVVAAMRGATPSRALHLAARIDAAASVACQCAVAEALERVASIHPRPPRTRAVRALALAGEAVRAGLDWTLRCAEASNRPGPVPELEHARARLLAATADAFGHPFAFDLVVPGGIATDPAAAVEDRLRSAVALALPVLDRSIASHADEASGLVDAARSWVAAPFRIIRSTLRAASEPSSGSDDPSRTAHLPEPTRPWPDGEGFGVAPSNRGSVCCWLRLSGGVLSAFHLHHPAIERLASLLAVLPGLPVDRLPSVCALADVATAGIEL